jgi:hypothetical protein
MGGMTNHKKLVDVAAQNAAITVRRAVPALRGTRIPMTAAALDLIPSTLRKSRPKGGAFEACVANLAPDTPTAVRDAGYTALRVEEAAVAAWEAEVVTWLDANVESKLAEHDDLIPNEVAEALAHITEAEEIAERIARRTSALARARNHDGRKRFTAHGTLKLAGGESIHNARVGFEALLPQPPVLSVPQAEYRRLRDVGEDMSGYRITHSPEGLLPRGAGLA